MIYSDDDLSRMVKTFNKDSSSCPIVEIDIEKDCYILNHITLYAADRSAADGHYTKIAIPKTYPQKGIYDFNGTLPEMSQIYQDNGWEVPSSQLFCAIVEQLSKEYLSPPGPASQLTLYNMLRDEDSIFNFEGSGYMNTIVDLDDGKIIHYPEAEDLKGKLTTIEGNVGMRKEYTFDHNFILSNMIFDGVGPTTLRILQGLTNMYPDELKEAWESCGKTDGCLRAYKGNGPDFLRDGIFLPEFVGGPWFNIFPHKDISEPKRVPLIKILEK